MNDTTNKNQIVSKLNIIYKLTDNFSGMCPHGCALCEDRETLMLLPFEEELIRQDIEESQTDMFLKNCYGYCYQPLGYSCSMLCSSGTCKVYQKRPFDCRSFPIVPHFRSDNSIEFFLANSYCPVVKNLPSSFIKTTIECWQSIAENLSSDWKMMYNKLNQQCYTDKVHEKFYK